MASSGATLPAAAATRSACHRAMTSGVRSTSLRSPRRSDVHVVQARIAPRRPRTQRHRMSRSPTSRSRTRSASRWTQTLQRLPADDDAAHPRTQSHPRDAQCPRPRRRTAATPAPADTPGDRTVVAHDPMHAHAARPSARPRSRNASPSTRFAGEPPRPLLCGVGAGNERGPRSSLATHVPTDSARNLGRVPTYPATCSAPAALWWGS
jgi:hypothetical protein